MTKNTRLEENQSQQVCGLQPKEYAKALNFSKLQCLKLMPLVFDKFTNLSKPFIAVQLPLLLKQTMQENPSIILDMFTFSQCLIKTFGTLSIDCIKIMLF